MNKTLQDTCAPSALPPAQLWERLSTPAWVSRACFGAPGVQVTDADRANVPVWVQAGGSKGRQCLSTDCGIAQSWTRAGDGSLRQCPHWFFSPATRHLFLTRRGALRTPSPALPLSPGPHQHPLCLLLPSFSPGAPPHTPHPLGHPLKVPSVSFHSIACWSVKGSGPVIGDRQLPSSKRWGAVFKPSPRGERRLHPALLGSCPPFPLHPPEEAGNRREKWKTGQCAH